jgi:hypothetical protein
MNVIFAGMILKPDASTGISVMREATFAQYAASLPVNIT